MASGNTLLVFSVLSFVPLAANYPTFTTRNTHPILGFNKDTAQYVYFESVMPQTYVGTSGFSVYVTYACTVTSGDVVWSCSMDRIGTTQNIDADTFGSVVSTTSTVSGTSGIMTVSQHDFTSASYTDSIAKGESFRLKIGRYADSTADTAAGTAQLYLVELREI